MLVPIVALALCQPVQSPAGGPLAPATGTSQRFLAAADLCGGPAAELIDAGGPIPTIVRIDEASGRWEAQSLVAPASQGERQVALADLDGDGRCDVLLDGGLIFNETPTGASRFVGTFAPSSFSGAQVSRLVGAPDLDGNGLGDAVFLDSTIPWLPGTLKVAWQPAPRTLTSIATLSPTPVLAATLVDADADGDDDLAVLTDGLRLQVWESGVVSSPPSLLFDAPIAAQGPSGGPYDLVADDLDGDGLVDLVVCGAALEVFRATGSAAFAPAGPVTPLAHVGDARLVDVDRDGDLDLTFHWGRTEAYLAFPGWWIERTGPLAFTGPVEPLLGSGGSNALTELVIGDFDGDGQGDLAGGRWIVDIGTIALPLPAGGPGEFVPLRVGPAAGPTRASLDLDLDGDADLIAVDSVAVGSGALVAFETVAPGETRERVRLPAGSAGGALVRGQFGVGSPAEEVATVRADGVLTLIADPLDPGGPTVLELASGCDPSRSALAAFDQDGDGDDDIVALRDDRLALIVVRQTSPGVFDAPAVVLDAIAGAPIQSFVDFEWDGAAPRDLVTIESTVAGTSARLQRGAATGFTPSSDAALLPGAPVQVRASSVPGVNSGVYIAPAGGAEIVRYSATSSGSLITPTVVASFPTTSVVDFDVERATVFGPQGGLVVLEADGASRRVRGHPFAPNVGIADLGEFPPTTLRIELDDVDGDGTRDAVLSSFSGTWWRRIGPIGPVAVPYCTQPSVNSIGITARIRAGIVDAPTGAAALRLDAVDLPPGATTLFLTGRGVAALPGAGGALGTLCLGGTLGRFVAPGQVLTANAGGAAGQDVDPLALPSGGQLLPVAIGDVWAFQAWYRDVDAAGNPVSRLTDAVLATF